MKKNYQSEASIIPARLGLLLTILLFISGCATEYTVYEAEHADEGGYRALIVAGCVPLDLSGQINGPVGSIWVPCNDLDFAEEDVEQTDLVSCKDFVDNGVIRSMRISEAGNRRWEFFQFSCVAIDKENGVPIRNSEIWTPRQFDFPKEGTVFETSVPGDGIPVGILEVNNYLQLKESLLRIGIEHLSMDEIIEDGVNDTWPENTGVSPRIPDASPVLINTDSWYCPPGMALTGAAVGHIPRPNGSRTRAVYLLGECRTIFKRVVRN